MVGDILMQMFQNELVELLLLAACFAWVEEVVDVGIGFGEFLL